MLPQSFKDGSESVAQEPEKREAEHRLRLLRAEYKNLLLTQQLRDRASDPTKQLPDEVFNDGTRAQFHELREEMLRLEEAIHGRNDIENSMVVAGQRIAATAGVPTEDLNAQAVVLIVEKNRFIRDATTGRFRLEPVVNAGSYYELCADEPRAADVTARSIGSGVLVGPSCILTAAHCVDGLVPLEDLYFVFDFVEKASKRRKRTQTRTEFDPGDVYEGKRILEEDATLPADWAVIQLKLPVQRRQPVQIHQGGPITTETEVYVIGHPLGLSRKRAGGARVRDDSSPETFTANLDVFGGNSGSPIFSTETQQLLGVVVDGSADLLLCGDCADGCHRPQLCPDTGCNGEVVVRITEVAKKVNFAMLP
jgi:hypothetical protein